MVPSHPQTTLFRLLCHTKLHHSMVGCLLPWELVAHEACRIPQTSQGALELITALGLYSHILGSKADYTADFCEKVVLRTYARRR